MKDLITKRIENGFKVYENENCIYSKIGDFIEESTYDEKGNRLTYKTSKGFSDESTYDEKGNRLTYRNSDGYSSESTYDKFGNELTYKNSKGYSYEYTYDKNNNILTKTENGELVIDNRPKKVTLELTQEQLDKIKEILEEK